MENMAVQQQSPSRQGTTPVDFHGRASLSDESRTVIAAEDRPSGGKEGGGIKAGLTIPTLEVNDYPDGGLGAWCVVLGATCACFATFGLVNSWGVFLSHYALVFIPETPTSTIAWIGSIQYSLVLLPGLVAGHLSDLGYFKRTLFISSVILVVATLVTAECKKFWQLLLFQGFLTGVAAGMVYGPVASITSQWFEKRRSLALGIVATGSSIGGTVIPIAARKLFPLIGFKWTMRSIALIELFMLVISNFTLKRRIDPQEEAGSFFTVHEFKKPAFNAFTISGILCFLGFTLLAYIDLSATKAGVASDFSFYLVAITNAGSGLGRISSGILADKFGGLTVAAPLTLLCAIMAYVWPFVTTARGFIAVAITYGFCSGAFVALIPVPVTMMGDIRDAGRRTGTTMTCMALGALAGPPISGAIAQATGGFRGVGYYAGSCILGSVGFLFLTKYLMKDCTRGKC